MNYRRNSQVSSKLYKWLLCASKRIQQHEKCNVKRGKRIGGMEKKGLASNRWCSSAEKKRWWEGADGHGRFRKRHAVWNKLRELQV